MRCACSLAPPPPNLQDYVASQLGQKFIEPQTAELSVAFKDSGPKAPLIFILSQGTDPADDLYKFAEKMKFGKKLSSISLGQGQVSRLTRLDFTVWMYSLTNTVFFVPIAFHTLFFALCLANFRPSLLPISGTNS